VTSSSDGLLALCAKRISDLQTAFAKLSKMPGPEGRAGRDGVDGATGQQGPQGERGVDGRNGLDGAPGAAGLNGRDGVPGPRGPAGPRGEPGPAGKDGERGPAPDHQWKGTRLRFQKPEGDWGKWVDLKGDAGVAGSSGGGGGFIGGSSFDLDTLPAADNAPTPTEVLVRQDGVWVRASWAQFSAWVGSVTPPTGNGILTEGGDRLLAEDGNVIVQE
jgi:hypothetical protein